MAMETEKKRENKRKKEKLTPSIDDRLEDRLHPLKISSDSVSGDKLMAQLEVAAAV